MWPRRSGDRSKLKAMTDALQPLTSEAARPGSTTVIDCAAYCAGVRVGVPPAVVRPEAASPIRKLMAERNIPAPPIDRSILSVCVVALCQGTSP